MVPKVIGYRDDLSGYLAITSIPHVFVVMVMFLTREHSNKVLTNTFGRKAADIGENKGYQIWPVNNLYQHQVKDGMVAEPPCIIDLGIIL